MAMVPMVDAVPGTVASSAEYNKIIDNVEDLNTRTLALEAAGTPTGLPFLHVYQAVGSSVPNNTLTALTWDTELSDTHNWHATNAATYVPQLAGRYRCVGMVSLAGGLTGPFMAQFLKNGSIYAGARYNTEHAVNQGFLANTVITEATIICNGTTDTISLGCQHNFGSTQTTFVGTGVASYMIIEYKGT